MALKNISFRIEEDLKNESEKVLKDIGLSMSATLTMLLQQIVNKRALPFIIEETEPFYSRENRAILDQRIQEYKAGKLEQHELIEGKH